MSRSHRLTAAARSPRAQQSPNVSEASARSAGIRTRRHRPAHSTSYSTLGVRERIGQHHGRGRATVFLELRAALDPS